VIRQLFFAPVLFLATAFVANGAQILVNPNFETTPNHQTPWLKAAEVGIIDYSLESNFFVPGAPPDGNGPWGAQVEANGSAKQGNVRQNVTVPAGTYRVDASALVRIFDNGTEPTTPSMVTLELRVDNNIVDTIVFSNDGSSVTDDWTAWTRVGIPSRIVNPTTSLGVRLVMRADGQDGTWGQVVADSFQLNVIEVPEPSAVALLGVCGAMLVGRRRASRTA